MIVKYVLLSVEEPIQHISLDDWARDAKVDDDGTPAEIAERILWLARTEGIGMPLPKLRIATKRTDSPARRWMIFDVAVEPTVKFNVTIPSPSNIVGGALFEKG